MPMEFKSNSPLPYDEMFDGRLQRFGVYERIGALTTAGRRSLTDGRNSIWIDAGHDGFVSKMTVWGTNDPEQIFAAMSRTFGVDVAPEAECDERQKTGFDDKLYVAISDRLHEEPYRTLANQILVAEDVWDVLFKVRLLIGLELAKEDPTLMQLCKKSELLTRINVVYQGIERAFCSEDLRYASEIKYMNRKTLLRLKAEEDQHEGPTDNALLFQVNENRTIVAVERPDIVARRLAEREKDNVPF